MAVMLSMAAIVLVAANRKGHYPIFIPIAVSLVWIAVAYALDIMRLIDDEDAFLMIRGGIFVLSLSLIVGGGIYIWSSRKNKKKKL